MTHISFDGPLTVEEMFLKFRVEIDLCKTVPVGTGIVSDWSLLLGKINFLGYCIIYLRMYAIKSNIIILGFFPLKCKDSTSKTILMTALITLTLMDYRKNHYLLSPKDTNKNYYGTRRLFFFSPMRAGQYAQ